MECIICLKIDPKKKNCASVALNSLQKTSLEKTWDLERAQNTRMGLL